MTFQLFATSAVARTVNAYVTYIYNSTWEIGQDGGVTKLLIS